MIKLKTLFYAIAYCNQHIKTYKKECKSYGISPSRFYNIKQDIVRYLLVNSSSLGLGVTITSHEAQSSEPKNIELVGILFKTQSLDELHVHQVYSHCDDLIPSELLPALSEYTSQHSFVSDWNEEEFIGNFNLILNWAKQQKIENFYNDLDNIRFVQKMQRWYWNLAFMWGKDKRYVRIKKQKAPKKTWEEYNINGFRKNATEILNSIGY